MAKQSPIAEQLAKESHRRARLAIPAVAGGVLYLLSAIMLNAALSGLPAVGIVQGLSPALGGRAAPAASPRAAEVAFIDKRAFDLIASSILTAIAVGLLVLVLLFILDATRYRRPQTWPPARPAVLVGGIAFAVLNVVHWVAIAVQAHNFTHGHDFSGKAVDRALLTSGGLGVTLQALGLFVALALTVGMIATMVATMRAGLLPRWLAVLGIFAGLLFLPLFGSSTFQLIPTFWMVAVGILFLGRLPGGDPPAWASGEATPWPTQAELREQREAGEPRPRGGAKPQADQIESAEAQAGGKNGSGLAREPALPHAGGRSARRRKRR
jgi:hypothetical protein